MSTQSKIFIFCTSAWVFAWSFFSPALAFADGLGLEGSVQKAIDSGNMFYALALVFAAGLATSLTPCVYPMIAITVSVFGARQAKSKGEGALLSMAFVLGMATLFTPLGMVAAMTGGVFGSALSSPPVLIGLALFFVMMAASMFGAFELALPPSIQNRLAQAGGSGVKGAFVLGLVSALIAAPCTGPVLGFLLTWVGTSGDLVFGSIALFVYALGLGVLFFAVGTFSIGLPKSGRWLEWIKSIFGIVMLVAALYYLKNMLPFLEELASKTWTFLGSSLGLIVLGIVIGAIHLSFHGTSTLTRLRKAVGIVAAVLGLAGVTGYLQAVPEGAHVVWMEDYNQAVALAKDQNKPLIVDFGASWCNACGELERHTFSHPSVVKESARFVAVRVDLSPGKTSPEKKEILGQYKHRGLPLVVVHHADGKEAGRVTEFIEGPDFLKVLRQAK